jgi:hypothetical protein
MPSLCLKLLLASVSISENLPVSHIKSGIDVLKLCRFGSPPILALWLDENARTQ